MNQQDRPSQSIPGIQNFVVARYRDGKIIKGVTHDFGAQKKMFHIIPSQQEKSEQGRKGLEVSLSELKAVFFVKSLEGKEGPHLPESASSRERDPVSPKKIKITFFDGETLEGATHGYAPEREGFFVVPLEKDTNNLRIFVVSKSVMTIETWK
jgi:hypothetical protein